MRLSRRGLLRGLPSIPFFARQLGKEVDQQIADQAGISVLGKSAETEMFDMGRRVANAQKLKAIYHTFGIPSFQKKLTHRRARRMRTLDPDIAVLRSVSMIAKMQMQWRRNEERSLRNEFRWIDEALERKIFNETHGLENDDYY